MTLAQALELVKGDLVTNKHTPVSMEPVPVTEVWINHKRTIVLVRLAKISPNAWLDALGYDLPEIGKVWCAFHKRWEWSADHRRLHPDEYAPKKSRARTPQHERGAR